MHLDQAMLSEIQTKSYRSFHATNNSRQSADWNIHGVHSLEPNLPNVDKEYPSTLLIF